MSQFQPPPYQRTQPDLPTYQPPEPPRKRRERKETIIAVSIVLAILVVIGAVSIVFALSTSKSPANTAQATATATSIPTAMPTLAPTPTEAPTQPPTPTATPTVPLALTPTQASVTHGTPRLGGSLSDFIGTYGPLNHFSQPSNGQYYFTLYGNDQNDLTLLLLDGKHVDTVTQDAPNNKPWSESTAIATCLAFAPPGTVYKRQMDQTSGGTLQDIQRVYVSPSLASVFPASDFTDENGNQTTLGTVGLILDYALNSTTSFMDCTLQVGLQAN